MVVPLDNVLSARQKEAFKEEERFSSQSDKVHTYGQKEFYSKSRSQKFCFPCQIMNCPYSNEDAEEPRKIEVFRHEQESTILSSRIGFQK